PLSGGRAGGTARGSAVSGFRLDRRTNGVSPRSALRGARRGDARVRLARTAWRRGKAPAAAAGRSGGRVCRTRGNIAALDPRSAPGQHRAPLLSLPLLRPRRRRLPLAVAQVAPTRAR